MKKLIVLGLATYAVPLVSLAFAQTPVFGGTNEFIDAGISLTNKLIILAGALALLAFFWGLVKFISKAGDTKAQSEGRSLMVWGAIALFVMVTIWGILAFIQKELRLDPKAPIELPQINVQQAP